MALQHNICGFEARGPWGRHFGLWVPGLVPGAISGPGTKIEQIQDCASVRMISIMRSCKKIDMIYTHFSICACK